MERFVGKVAIVTGASSGIGAQIAEDLVKAGLVVAGIARRLDKVEALAEKLTAENFTGRLHPIKADVTIESELLAALAWVKNNLGPIHVLVNNAGCHSFDTIIDGSTEAWRTVLDTNVLSMAIATREAVRNMKENNVDGQIILMNSGAGHTVSRQITGMYSPSKYAVTAMTESIRWELIEAGSKIKISSISPGTVKTDMTLDTVETYKMKYLEAVDISNAALYIIGTPPDVQVHDILIKPIGQIL